MPISHPAVCKPPPAAIPGQGLLGASSSASPSAGVQAVQTASAPHTEESTTASMLCLGLAAPQHNSECRLARTPICPKKLSIVESCRALNITQSYTFLCAELISLQHGTGIRILHHPPATAKSLKKKATRAGCGHCFTSSYLYAHQLLSSGYYSSVFTKDHGTLWIC